MVARVSGNNYEITEEIAKHAASSKIIDLSRDDSVAAPDPRLLNIAARHLGVSSGLYSPSAGDMKLREILSELTEREYSHQFNPQTEITITSGALQAVNTAVSALAGEGDEVIIIEPAHPAYYNAVLATGARPVYIALQRPDYSIDWEAIQKVVTGQTRLIIINSPHNPTGKIYTALDMEKLQKLTMGTNISVISDESFAHCVFEGYEHQSVARFPQLAERSLIVFSFGKSLNISGWKIGYCLGPEKLTREFRKRQQVMMGNVNTPLQLAISEYLKKHPGSFQNLHVYEENRNLFLKLMQGSKWQFKPSLGTYFQLMSYANMSDEKEVDFSLRLLKNPGIAVLPLSVFFHDSMDTKVVRFNISLDKAQLEAAAEKLSSL